MMLRTWCALALMATIVLAESRAMAQEVELLGSASVPGDARDLSGLKEVLPGEVPHDRLGGFSGVEYLGDDRYLVLSDRGPGDGIANYSCRVHQVRISRGGAASNGFEVELVATTLLRDAKGQNLVGLASAIDGQCAANSLRFDPEGIRGGRDGMIWLSDEYGPSMVGFDAKGRRERELKLPAHFGIACMNAEPGKEDLLNRCGRQENRGLEGLAISPDGKKLYGLMQGPLLQDGARDDKGLRAGSYCRIVEIEIASNATREFLYALDHPSLGLNEIVAMGDEQFLVIERDGKEGKEATAKKIYRIDLRNAPTIEGTECLPANGLATDVCVKKQLLIDLLDPKFGLAGEKFPQKVEGLSFGPTLLDGRRLLVVCTDNDFMGEKASWFYFFAVR